MRKLLIIPFLLITILLLGACSKGFKADFNLDIPEFAYTNQHGETVTLDDLKGEVWLAQFVFTNCTTVCGPMMVNMADIQDKLIEENIEDYKLVSFTVDPAVDSPEVLQEYLDRYAPSDESKWEMLTGYKQSDIIPFAKKSFATLVIPVPDSDQVNHGTSFSLVNQEGKVVKMYSGNIDVPFDEIVQDMKALIKQGA